MLSHLLADGGDLVEGMFDGNLAGDLAGDPDGKKNSVESAFFHARDVDAAGGVARAKIEIAVDETLRGVGVSVDNDRREMQLVGASLDVVGTHLRVSGGGSECEEAESGRK